MVDFKAMLRWWGEGEGSGKPARHLDPALFVRNIGSNLLTAGTIAESGDGRKENIPRAAAKKVIP